MNIKLVSICSVGVSAVTRSSPVSVISLPLSLLTEISSSCVLLAALSQEGILYFFSVSSLRLALDASFCSGSSHSWACPLLPVALPVTGSGPRAQRLQRVSLVLVVCLVHAGVMDTCVLCHLV